MRATIQMSAYLTPVDKFYPTCERTHAVLRIHCGQLSPIRVTEILGLEPTESVKKGVAGKPNKLGLSPIGKVNLWMLDSEGHVDSLDLRDHIDWLLDRIESSSSNLLALRAQGVVMDVWTIWWSKNGDGGPTIWPSQMRRLALLDLELSIGFSFYGND